MNREGHGKCESPNMLSYPALGQRKAHPDNFELSGDEERIGEIGYRDCYGALQRPCYRKPAQKSLIFPTHRAP